MSTQTTISDLLLQSAPWLTAVGAVGLGYLNHRRSSRTDRSEEVTGRITELHALYQSLVKDLSANVDRQRNQLEQLHADNLALTLRHAATVKERDMAVAALETLQRAAQTGQYEPVKSTKPPP